MPTPNEKTLASYEDRYQAYIDGTTREVSGGVKAWIENALKGLAFDARIMEIGSAYGRDALFIEKCGYRVHCTDAVPSFIGVLHAKGLHASFFDLLKDTFEERFDLIFANAVLLHFTRAETENTLEKVLSALHENGRFAFSLKQGEGEKWSEEKIGRPRFFHYWRREDIEKLLKRAGYAYWTIDDDGSGHGSDEWLHIVAFRASLRDT